MRAGRVGRMPFAVDDADGDLALPLGKRVMAGMKMSPERSRGLRQFGVVYPDLTRPADLTADLFQNAIALLLLGRHFVIGDLGVTAKGRCVGHFRISFRGLFGCCTVLTSSRRLYWHGRDLGPRNRGAGFCGGFFGRQARVPMHREKTPPGYA